MGTHAAIIMKTKENTYRGIYVHYDGYVRHTGTILVEEYNTEEKVEELINLGDLSFLDRRLNPIGAHSFEAPENGTTIAYHRDRDEDLRISTYSSQYDFEGIEQYVYVFEDGEWTVNGKVL